MTPDRPRILLIRPDHLGDVLLTTPAVELLRKALPQAHLTMMVGPWAEELARRDPLVDEVRVCPFPGFTRSTRGAFLDPYRLLWTVADDLRRAQFDAALALRFDHWWGAWTAAQARIPVRVGHGVAECNSFLTHAVTPLPREHWTERSLRVAKKLLDAWGCGEVTEDMLPLRFGLRQADEVGAATLWRELDLEEDSKVVAMHPGAGAALKQWPEERWTEVGSALVANGARVLVSGTPSEAPAAQRIVSGIPGAVSLAGKTELGVLAALYRRCGLVVGVDSGPLHLAVAVGAPSVCLFGPTDPAVYGPWGERGLHRVVAADVPGAPCNRLDFQPVDGISPACMRSISVDRVLAECREVMRILPLGESFSKPPPLSGEGRGEASDAPSPLGEPSQKPPLLLGEGWGEG